MTLDQLTEADILAFPAGPELDGLVDDVLGVDRQARTPSEIRAVVSDAEILPEELPSQVVRIYLFGGKRWEVRHDPVDGPYAAGWPWEQREGKPWQEAMERHVAAWRKSASKPWSTDGNAMLELVERIRKRGWGNVGMAADARGKGTCRAWIDGLGGITGWAEADTIQLALCRSLLLQAKRKG